MNIVHRYHSSMVFGVDNKQHQVKMHRDNSSPSSDSNFPLRDEQNHFCVLIGLGSLENVMCVSIFGLFPKFDALFGCLFVCLLICSVYGEFSKIEFRIEFINSVSLFSTHSVQLTLFTSQNPHYATN